MKVLDAIATIVSRNAVVACTIREAADGTLLVAATNEDQENDLQVALDQLKAYCIGYINAINAGNKIQKKDIEIDIRTFVAKRNCHKIYRQAKERLSGALEKFKSQVGDLKR